MADDVDWKALSGLEQLRWMQETGNRPAMLRTIDGDLETVERGRVVFVATPDGRFYNPLGSIHGGYAATLLDSACGCAIHSMLEVGQGYTTLELKVSYHRAIRTGVGEVRAEGTVLSIGRKAGFAEARLTGPDGTLYASATSTLIVLDAR